MAILYSSESPKTERFSTKTDHSLIEAVQNRSKLLKTGTDRKHPAIRAGERAFAELLMRYDRWLWKQVRRFSGLDLNEAYSYALQGFERAIDKFDLHSDCPLVGFAAVVVRHAIQLLLRREQRHREKVAMAAEAAPLYHEDEFVDPYENEQREQSVEALHSEVEQLEVSRQKIVEMRQSGMKFSEIGAFFSKTADTVRMIYSRAIARLKKHLQPQIVEVETPTAPASDPTPTADWMGRLWARFCKSVRFSNSSAISDSSTSIESPNALEVSVNAPKRPVPSTILHPLGVLNASRSPSTKQSLFLGLTPTSERLGFIRLVRRIRRPPCLPPVWIPNNSTLRTDHCWTAHHRQT
jgi:RNA polymerase sigma factor (sigma-70 family)